MMKITLKRKRFLATGVTLISTVALVMVASLTIPTGDSMKSSDEDRAPASQLWSQLRSGTAYVEQQLAEQVAKFTDRSTASIGKPADPIENLRFGILKGKYSLVLNQDKIQEIQFIDNPNTEGRPLDIGDRSNFVDAHKLLFGAVGVPERLSIEKKGFKIVESYRVATNKKDESLLIDFTLDDSERVFSITSRKISSLKIF